VTDANHLTGVDLPDFYSGSISWRAVCQSANRNCRVKSQLRATEVPGNRQGRAGVGQIVLVDEVKYLEVGFAHCFSNCRRLWSRCRRQIGYVIGGYDDVFDLDIAEIRAGQAFCQFLQRSETLVIVACYYTAQH